jgi:CRP/FNR family cyclic AMP-dependent transcriptional regulator
MAGKNDFTLNPLDLSERRGLKSSTQTYRGGEAIFAQGEKADAIFYIHSGNVKLTAKSKGGKKAVTSILRCGDLFGEGCLAKQALRTSTATAIHLSSITEVKRAAIVRIVQQEPAFAKLFISHLLLRIGRIEEALIDQVCNSSEKRLARTLLLLTGFGLDSQPEPDLKIDQETLAEMVGTTRSRVSYFMNRFREMGLIDYNGKLHVHESLHTFLLND